MSAEATAKLAKGFETRAATPAPAIEMTRLWSLDEVAEFLGMSKAWVRDHATRRQPRIACVRMGGHRAILRFRRCDIEQFVNENWQGAGD